MILVRKLLGFLGLDRSILWASSGRMLPLVLGPVGSIIVVFTLNPKEQGTYYLFLSLIALKSFFDLGATAAIAQMTPHVRSGASDRSIDPEFIAVATGMIRKIAIIFGLVCGAIGVAFLLWTDERSVITHLMWLGTVGATALGGSIEGHTQIVYGSGKVNEVSKMKILGTCIQYPIQWTLLLLGFSLFSFVVSMFAIFLWQNHFLRKRHPYLWEPAKEVTERREKFRFELRSLIKKASITYMSGFLIFQVQQPITFKLLGAEESAKLGFTGVIGSTLIGIAGMWGLTSFPRFADAVARGDIEGGFSDYKKTLLRTVLIASFGVMAAVVTIMTLELIPRFDSRLMEILPALPLLATFWLQTVTGATTYWPRSFKIEPFASIAIAQMIITPLAVYLFIRQFGIAGVGMGTTTGWLIAAIGIFTISKRYFPKSDIPESAHTLP